MVSAGAARQLVLKFVTSGCFALTKRELPNVNHNIPIPDEDASCHQDKARGGDITQNQPRDRQILAMLPPIRTPDLLKCHVAKDDCGDRGEDNASEEAHDAQECAESCGRVSNARRRKFLSGRIH